MSVKFGVTGHQRRDGADWAWVEAKLRRRLAACPSPPEGWSALAAGTDQIFARAILEADGRLVGVIPLDTYEAFFADPAALAEYRRLLRHCSAIVRLDAATPDAAFRAAGRRIVDACARLVAVWDGDPSGPPGSTADIVAYAWVQRRPITRLDPVARRVFEDWHPEAEP